MSTFLTELERWSREGSLISVILAGRLAEGIPGSPQPWNTNGESRVLQLFTKAVKDFKIAGCRPGGKLSMVETKLNLSLEIATALKEFVQDPYGGPDFIPILRIIHRFHKALGGELWVAGTLCWKDGNQAVGITG
jgi:hypothetical protein